ncbi:MAG: uroporphyrinogen-III synthase [Bacteroidetes bacterium]|nr:MAG: uroporphyrinogen-III synthase [Bacteroidota bacterium]
MPNQRVFISRKLKPDSPFQAILTKAGFEVHGESLLEFEPVSFEVIPPADWVFFYSQNAVVFFAKGLAGRALPAGTRLAAIGASTAQAVVRHFGTCDFAGNGQPDEVAREFLKIAKGQNVLFPQAENSRRAIQTRAGDQIRAHEIVVYRNRPKVSTPPPDFDIFVFTSPLNVRAFAQKHSLPPTARYIAIGPSTFEALRHLGFPDIAQSETPSETGLAKAVLEPQKP